MILLCGLISASCNNTNNHPDAVLPPDKMQAVLWDIIRVNAFTSDFIKRDSSKNLVKENAELQKKVFALHRVSRESFYKSLTYYKNDPALFKTMVDSMITRATRDRSARITN